MKFGLKQLAADLRRDHGLGLWRRAWLGLAWLVTDGRRGWNRWTAQRRRLNTVRMRPDRTDHLCRYVQGGSVPVCESIMAALEEAGVRAPDLLDADQRGALWLIWEGEIHGSEYTKAVKICSPGWVDVLVWNNGSASCQRLTDSAMCMDRDRPEGTTQIENDLSALAEGQRSLCVTLDDWKATIETVKKLLPVIELSDRSIGRLCDLAADQGKKIDAALASAANAQASIDRVHERLNDTYSRSAVDNKIGGFVRDVTEELKGCSTTAQVEATIDFRLNELRKTVQTALDSLRGQIDLTALYFSGHRTDKNAHADVVEAVRDWFAGLLKDIEQYITRLSDTHSERLDKLDSDAEIVKQCLLATIQTKLGVERA